MEMIVPDDIRAAMLAFGIDPNLLLNLWQFIDVDISTNYQILRTNRPADFMHEGFLVSHVFPGDGVMHIFHIWVDDSSATDRLFLRDIQHETI